MSVLSCQNLTKTFSEGPSDLTVLKGVNLSINARDKVAIVGASGSGKSTLLHLLGGLDVPTEGAVNINGEAMSVMSDQRRGEYRNRYLGFIYQFHHLLPEFSALENVAMPLLIRGDAASGALSQAEQMLTSVGLQKRLQHRPAELSGGERQRAAIARALVTKPACILADEPTGNLDHKTAETVFSVMLELNDKLDTALVMVTHDLNLAQRMDRVFVIEDGVLSAEESA